MKRRKEGFNPEEELKIIYQQALGNENLSVALKCLEMYLKVKGTDQKMGAHSLNLKELSDEELDFLLEKYGR